VSPIRESDDIISFVLTRAMQLVPEFPLDAARQIELESHHQFGGETIYITKNASKTERNRRMMDDYSKGMTASQLASKHRLTERRIRQIINTRSR